MPRLFITLPVLIGLSAAILGCDSQASQQAEAQRHLDAAMAKLQLANSGYIAVVDGSGQAEQPQNLLVYRQETMDSAFEDLNKVLNLNAPLQKSQALRLGAEIDLSAARHAARAASLEYAALAGRSTVLLGYMSAMESSATRAQTLQPQTETQLTRLQEEIETQSAKRDQLNAEIESLDSQRQSVAAETEQFRARANEGYAKAQTLREQAFVTSGDKMYDLQDQASELERKAAIESASAEQRQVLVNDLDAQLNLSRVQLDTVIKLLEELNGQVQSTRVDTERFADASTVAAQASDNAAKTLTDEFNQIMDVYGEAVEKRLKQAIEKTDKAIDALKQASQVREAAGDAQAINLQLLSAYVEQAYIASSHASYVRDLAGTTEAVLSSISRKSSSDTAALQTQLSRLTDAEVALRDKATAAIDTGRELAKELAPEGTTPDAGKTEEVALKQIDRLDAYADRLKGNG